VGQWLSERLGQPFIIENRPGAAGNIATEAVVRAPPDGYTLLLVLTNNAGNATLYDKLNFNFIRDIAPVASINRVPHVIDVNPSIRVRTVPEFIALAKANPGKLNMGSGSIGSTQHLSGELFKMMTGIDLVHVPYRGGAPAIADLLGGQVEKCKISRFNGDNAISISRCANAGAMRLANLRPTRRWKAGRVPRSISKRWPAGWMSCGHRRQCSTTAEHAPTVRSTDHPLPHRPAGRCGCRGTAQT
jgi:tripartite-type tricarboxylate transporter receptor subunit TctC